MKQVIEKDECDYMNPFGADDRENFIENFSELTKSEQRNFQKRAKLCMRENRAMTKWGLEPGAKTKAEDAEGTERFPYASVNQAEQKVQVSDYVSDFPSIQVVCAASCDKIECAEADCKKMVCKVHGEGRGQLLGDFCISQCMDCQVITCDDHFFNDCDVCRNGTNAQIS